MAGAEFDQYARDYREMHAASIAASGEDPEYFAVYKQRCVERILGQGFDRPVLDYGCGIGNLTRHLVDSFSEVAGFDPSSESIRFARERAPRATFHDDAAKLPRAHYGAAVLSGVLHHVAPRERAALLRTVVDCLVPSGRLIVFEHNPLNPLTRRAVAACEFDVDAELLYPWEVSRLLREARLADVRQDFIVFFPRFLAAMRGLEPRLAWLPLGAQVCAFGKKG